MVHTREGVMADPNTSVDPFRTLGRIKQHRDGGCTIKGGPFAIARPTIAVVKLDILRDRIWCGTGSARRDPVS